MFSNAEYSLLIKIQLQFMYIIHVNSLVHKGRAIKGGALFSVTEGDIRSNYIKLNLFVGFQVLSLVVTVNTRFIPRHVHYLYY